MLGHDFLGSHLNHSQRNANAALWGGGGGQVAFPVVLEAEPGVS